ncbi:hypothetical protein Cgig2_021814 [Carnegiea gigantea]|uniref:Uncharacterized protein n=1 Tax=Carnegiea gigantea TaxID=171969 RepID=A0A9Q1GUV4_9CARY|nr:hypothetical protein Cgig2_021814 [Carnegiea gigantea]
MAKFQTLAVTPTCKEIVYCRPKYSGQYQLFTPSQLWANVEYSTFHAEGLRSEPPARKQREEKGESEEERGERGKEEAEEDKGRRQKEEKEQGLGTCVAAGVALQTGQNKTVQSVGWSSQLLQQSNFGMPQVNLLLVMHQARAISEQRQLQRNSNESLRGGNCATSTFLELWPQ